MKQMQYISSIIPITYGLFAYMQTNSEPFHLRSPQGETLQKGTPEYNAAVQRLPGQAVREDAEVQSFLTRMGIRNDLLIIEDKNPSFCRAVGTNYFTRRGGAAVALCPGLYQIDPEACRHILKHEITHIKNNDAFVVPAFTAFCTALTVIFLNTVIAPLPLLALTFVISKVARNAMTYFIERRADNTAIAESSNEELLGGRRALSAQLQFERSSKNDLFGRFLQFINFSQPATLGRLRRINDALEQRNIIQTLNVVERKQLKQIKQLMIDNLTES